MTTQAASKTPLLDRVEDLDALRKLSDEELKQYADELRTETIDAVSVTGGHLGAGLGVVELTTAIHAVFNTPADRLIFDVGQSGTRATFVAVLLIGQVGPFQSASNGVAPATEPSAAMFKRSILA